MQRAKMQQRSKVGRERPSKWGRSRPKHGLCRRHEMGSAARNWVQIQLHTLQESVTETVKQA